MVLIRDFKQLGKGDVGLAGGKGASLGEMTQAGISVPPGFVVLANAFERFLEETDLNVEIDAALDAVNHKEIHTVEDASEKIQALILGGTMPTDIAAGIKKYFKKLQSPFVAVRSSATAEDSASAAWAGQLESFLNTTEKILLQNVQKCWASLFTPRAIFYRFEKGLHSQKISVAVVVQKMVQSEVSGIAFSVHPVTQDTNQMIIEAGFGLGEAIVSGQITPDSYVVTKKPRNILDKNIAVQERALVKSRAGKPEWISIPKAKGEKQALSDKQILQLSGLIVRIEKHYGFPVDIEWAHEKGKFYIVQSRPITTLSKKVKGETVIPNLRKEDYVLSFWVQGVSIFVTDIHREGYAALEVLYIIDKGLFKQYFTKKAFERALENGLKFYSDKHSFVAYRKELSNHNKSFQEFFETEIKGKDKLTKEILKKFFDFTSYLCKEYAKMNFEYTDKAFMLREQNKTIKSNLNLLATFKDQIRAFMNAVLFDRDGYLSKVFNILGKQFSLSTALLENLTQKELLGLYEGKKSNKSRVLKRQKAFVCLYNNPVPYEDTDAQVIAQRFEEKANTTNEIKGQTANEGRVSGKVKIIPVDYSNFARVNNEIKKMKQGEILVAETTAPELIIACKKAGAIITDMGGLMSHAAIVSREFGIPCIIGTKIATQVLKDGDLVEVDADKGVVRILKAGKEKKDSKFIKDRVFVKEHSREYSLFRVQILGDIYLKDFAELVQSEPIEAACLVYFGKGLVHACYAEETFEDIVRKVGAKAGDVKFVKRQIKEMNKLFLWLKPYFDGRKTPKSINELRNFYNEYTQFYLLVGVVYVIPLSKRLPQKVREMALQIRQVTQRYNEHPEMVFQRALERLYPRFKGRTNFILPQEVWNSDVKSNVEAMEKKIKEREKGFVYYRGKLYTGNVEQTLKRLNIVLKGQTQKAPPKEFKGQIAYKGKVEGIAKIVASTKDQDKVDEGDILVAAMTVPKYLPAMKRAAAFVTDEGGITCHAAIVAREMKKPCIIGTKIATHVLKDGDLVEVDADKGVVRILERRSVAAGEEWVFMFGTAPIMPSYWATAEAAKERTDIFSAPKVFQHFNGSVINVYFPRSDIERWKEEGKKFLDPTFFRGFLRKYSKESGNWWRWVRHTEKKDYARATRAELKKDHALFARYHRDAIAYFGTSRPEFTNAAEKRLEAIIKKQYGNRWPVAFGTLATSRHLDDVQKEYLDWLKLISEKRTDRASLLKHASKYPWLVFGQFSEQKVIEFFMHRKKDEKNNYVTELKRIKKAKADVTRAQSKIYRTLGSARNEARYLAHFLQTQAIERMRVKSCWAGAYYLTRKLWQKITDLTGLKLWDLLMFVTTPEIQKLLSGQRIANIRQIINDRRMAYVIDFKPGDEIKMLGSKDANALYKQRITKPDVTDKVIKGQTASLGLYRGPVRKVIAGDLEMLRRSIKRFKKGEILVTTMTQPNMMVIAQKAGAIVTDEGGITSHAAIISRELKIPCIVGCLHAMEVLNDGDLIEVDADKAIVKIVKKS